MTETSGGSLLRDPVRLRRLLSQLEGTDIDELEVVTGEMRLFLRREPRARGGAPPGTESVPSGTAIVAPLTGVFYLRPSPEQPPFVSVGDVVEVGQVVALIETMKLFNEVTADVAGEIVAIAVKDGDLVGTGQTLLTVRQREEGETA